VPGEIDGAHAALAARLIDLPGVTAVGVGEADGNPCLRVWVTALTDKLRAAIPPDVAGFRVLVEESGPIEALEDEQP